jgi:enoyl-[acyl-carrier protein] reductase I
MGILEGKNGVILGIANPRSIGWHIARASHKAGARLIFNYQTKRLEDGVRKLADSLSENITVLPCDLADDQQIDRFFEEVESAFSGKLDFLVHSVAFANREDLDGRFTDTSRDGFNLALEVSCYTLVAAVNRALPMMQAAGGGSVITLSYYGAEKVVQNYNVMGVAKAALECSVRYLSADLGPEGIRVNAISAGPIKTLAARGISGFGDILKVVEEKSPLRRNIEPEEVARTAVFLSSDEAGGITGETIHVDAGYHVLGL